MQNLSFRKKKLLLLSYNIKSSVKGETCVGHCFTDKRPLRKHQIYHI